MGSKYNEKYKNNKKLLKITFPFSIAKIKRAIVVVAHCLLLIRQLLKVCFVLKALLRICKDQEIFCRY